MTVENGDTVYPVIFNGKGGEYFRIWIVNILLTLITLYIYSAWAKVRTKRYFYGNTEIDGGPFEYHATPIQILKGRIVAVVLLIATVIASYAHPVIYAVLLGLFFIAMPWVVWRSLRFNAFMSSFRNVRFRYAGKCRSLYFIFLILPFLPLILCGVIAGVMYFLKIGEAFLPFLLVIGVLGTYLMLPLMQKAIASQVANNSLYGTSPFSAELTAKRYYWVYLLAVLLSLLILLLAIVLPATAATFYLLEQGLITPEMIDPENPELFLQALTPLMAPGLVVLIVFYLLAGTWIVAFVKTRLRNYLFDQTKLEKGVSLQSTVSTGSYWWLMVSNILLFAVTLGFGYPWTKVRTARYLASKTAVLSPEPLNDFVAEQAAQQSSLAEELGEAFDMDFDLAI